MQGSTRASPVLDKCRIRVDSDTQYRELSIRFCMLADSIRVFTCPYHAHGELLASMGQLATYLAPTPMV